MKPIIKVDRVCSVQEAITLQELGVDIISITPETNRYKWFDDCRQISTDVACQMQKIITKAKYCVEISLADINKNYSLIENNNFDTIEFLTQEIPDLAIQRKIKEKKIDIIYSSISVSYEDDPNWIFSPFQNVDGVFFQADLLSDVTDSWNFLKNQCPQYPDELIQVKDINQLSLDFPLIITLDFSVDNIRDILLTFPKIKGISLRLGENPIRNDLHYTDFPNLISILNVVNEIESDRAS